jgi:hypothetical protein
LFRGLNASLEKLSGFSDPEDSVGRSFVHKNFASCSRDIAVSKNFGSKCVLKFTLPAGAKSIVLGGQYSEKETVLPRNATFRIDKVEQGKNGCQNLVHVTYIGEADDDAKGSATE